jgi:NAD(P)-dependent dehydrogenase (short-subunit alcohol dehydrogenase family)
MAVALVTGSSSGIGLATAVTLARGGHQVIATMRNLDSAGELGPVLN